jgi:hypothetical protein
MFLAVAAILIFFGQVWLPAAGAPAPQAAAAPAVALKTITARNARPIELGHRFLFRRLVNG